MSPAKPAQLSPRAGFCSSLCFTSMACWLNLSDSTSHCTHGPQLQGADVTLPQLTASFGLPVLQAQEWVSLQSQFFLVRSHFFFLVTFSNCLIYGNDKVIKKKSSHKNVYISEGHLAFSSFWTKSCPSLLQATHSQTVAGLWVKS